MSEDQTNKSDSLNIKEESPMSKHHSDESNKKRKLDDSNGGGSNNKRSSKEDQDDNNDVHFKLLVPSSAAGGVIGRGGERIGQIQKDANVRIKMSKANEYYPNTNERICLVTGTVRSVLKAHALILERILEKPEMSAESERVNQIKFLIPNSTAGLLIGKGGAYIKQIKDDSGAFVQISSKSTDLPERIVTIDGDVDKRNRALQIIVKKISEDPQHNSVNTLNYSNLMSQSGGGGHNSSSGGGGGGGGNMSGMAGPNSMHGHGGPGNYMQDQYGAGSNANMNPGDVPMGGSGNSNNKFDFNSAAYYLAGLNNLALLIINCGGSFQMTADTLRGALRNTGYSSPASNEIIDAITVLMSYGLITKISPAALLAANPSLASLINLGPAGLANITTALAASMIGSMSNMGSAAAGNMNFSANSNMAPPQQQQQQHHAPPSHHHHHHQQAPQHQPSQHHHQHQGSNYHQFYANSNGTGSSNGLHHLGKVNKK